MSQLVFNLRHHREKVCLGASRLLDNTICRHHTHYEPFWESCFHRVSIMILMSVILCFKHLLPSATKLRRLCFYGRLSVHTGGFCLSAWWDTPPPEQTSPGSRPPRCRHPPRADTPGADTPPEQTSPLGADPPGADTPPDQTLPEQTLLQSRHPPGSRPPRSRHPLPRDGHCCGRYASYWNAFLLHIISRRGYG